ncbi:MAG: hypothetical protein ACI8PZ_006026 [Myxococcota bacterium]|jgi:hypothetical protein
MITLFLLACTQTVTTVVEDERVVVQVPEAVDPPDHRVITHTERDLEPERPIGESGRSVPVQGGGLLELASGLYAATDGESGRVFIATPIGPNARVEHAIDLGADSLPFRMSVDDERPGRLWVTLRGTGELAAVDTARGRVHARVPVCPAPRGVLAEPDAVWVVCATGELVQVDPESATVVNSWSVDIDLRDVVRDGEELAISRFRAADVVWVDPEHGAITARNRPYSIQSESPEGRLQPYEAAVAWRMAAQPEGGVVLAHQRALAGSIPETNGGVVLQPYYGAGPAAGCTSITWSTTSALQRDGTVAHATSIRAPLPVDLRVALNGGAQVMTIDGDVHRMGPGADGGVCRLFGGDALEAEITGVPVAFTPALGAPVYLTRAPLQLVWGTNVLELAPTSPESAAFERFHVDPGFGVSCASCHPEGHDDGRVWTFRTKGARRTQTLGLDLAELSALHWNGEFDDMRTLLTDVLVERMSGGAVELGADEDRALMAFLARTPPLVGSDRVDDAVSRGSELFWSEAVGCGECHNGPALTDGRRVDVGTGLPARTPTLLGIAQRGPWMHDGCALTLHQRFEDCGGGDKHGRTSHLGDDDIDALVAYLETL